MAAGAHVEALRPAGPTGWVALDEAGDVVATSPVMTALVGAASGAFAARVAPPDRGAVGAALADPGATVTLRGRRPDGVPFAVCLAALEPAADAAGLAGAAGVAPDAALVAGAGSATLLVGRRAGGPVRHGADPAPGGGAERDAGASARGVDHVLSHDLRGALRQATGFVTVARRAAATTDSAGDTDGDAGPEGERADAAGDVGADGDAGPDRDAGPVGHLAIALRSLANADAASAAVVRWLRLGDVPLTVAPVAASELVAEAAGRLAERVGEPSATSRLVVEHADLAATSVVVDAAVAAEGLVELLANAVVFWPGDGPVVVGVRPSDPGWCELTVRDGGPGVADPEAAMAPGRMLQPRGAFPGVGMGLALCDVVAARHGGWCAIEAADGAGALGVLGLPVG